MFENRETFPEDVIEAHKQPKGLGEQVIVRMGYLEPDEMGDIGKGVEATNAFVRDVSHGVLSRIESTAAIDSEDMRRVWEKFNEEDYYSSGLFYNDLRSVSIAFEMERVSSDDGEEQAELRRLENLADFAFNITSAMILNIKGKYPKNAEMALQESIKNLGLIETTDEGRAELAAIIDETASTILQVQSSH